MLWNLKRYAIDFFQLDIFFIKSKKLLRDKKKVQYLLKTKK